MTDLQIPDDLAEEIRREAAAEGLTTEAVLLTAWRHYRTLAQRRKIEAELNWWESLPANERREYSGQHVAVHQRQVVDHDLDPTALHNRVRERFGRTAILLIPADGPREICILSPRFERR